MILHVLESEETSVAYEQQEQVRIVQETVAGKEITFAHVMGGPGAGYLSKIGIESAG